MKKDKQRLSELRKVGERRCGTRSPQAMVKETAEQGLEVVTHAVCPDVADSTECETDEQIA